MMPLNSVQIWRTSHLHSIRERGAKRVARMLAKG